MNNPIPSAARLSIWLPGLLNLLPGFGTVFQTLVTGFLRQNSLFYGKRQTVLRSPGCSKWVNRLRNEELVHTQRAPKTATNYLSSNSDFRFFFHKKCYHSRRARPSVPGGAPLRGTRKKILLFLTSSFTPFPSNLSIYIAFTPNICVCCFGIQTEASLKI